MLGGVSKLLTADGVAAVLREEYSRRMTARTWRTYVYRGDAPAPDAYATTAGIIPAAQYAKVPRDDRDRPLWKPTTVAHWATTPRERKPRRKA